MGLILSHSILIRSSFSIAVGRASVLDTTFPEYLIETPLTLWPSLSKLSPIEIDSISWPSSRSRANLFSFNRVMIPFNFSSSIINMLKIRLQRYYNYFKNYPFYSKKAILIALLDIVSLYKLLAFRMRISDHTFYYNLDKGKSRSSHLDNNRQLCIYTHTNNKNLLR